MCEKRKWTSFAFPTLLILLVAAVFLVGANSLVVTPALALTEIHEPASSPMAEAPLNPIQVVELERNAAQKRWTFTFSADEMPAAPVEELTTDPSFIAEAFAGEGSPLPLGPAELPAWFDWRIVVGLTPVKSQVGNTCGPFSLIGVLESVLRIRERVTENLSETYYSSCPSSTASDVLECEGDGYDECWQKGMVRETAFPGDGQSQLCGCPYPHPYCVAELIQMPSEEPDRIRWIKQAVLTYGPASVTLSNVDSAFAGYSGGIFNACSPGSIPAHWVVIVGWDDHALDENGVEHGVWIIRNSWGDRWGKSGYMRIEYGCAGIESRAVGVIYLPKDCNKNGIPDRCDLECSASGCDLYPGCGGSLDANGNDTPDECERDCNGNGIPDDVDVAQQTSSDINSNSIPDECEDCNANGILDECDVRCEHMGGACAVAGCGQSSDCNENKVPDECETDCNGNGIPDDCDLDQNLSVDLDDNGVPDECDPWVDCNSNGVRDAAEIFRRTDPLPDCNNNGVPDECEFAAGTMSDCDTDGFPDECEISFGYDADCQPNGVPDACEIAEGTSLDVDLNGVPDECQHTLRVPAEYPSILAAIEAAVNGDVVLVAPGTYTGEDNKNLQYDRKAIAVQCDGWPGDCVIDCEDSGRAFHFRFATPPQARLDGFAVVGANAPYPAGAILIEDSAAPTIANCIVQGNTCPGVYCYSAFPRIERCRIVGNSASGVDAYNTQMTIEDSVIAGNAMIPWGYGGGLHVMASDVSLVNCTIVGNYARVYGGGISAGTSGGINSNLTLSHCIVWDNSARGQEPAMMLWEGSTATVSYTNFQGGYPGVGNIQVDPDFVSRTYYDDNGTPSDFTDDDWVIGDPHLLPTSLCIDAGDPAVAQTTGRRDVDGEPRWFDGDGNEELSGVWATLDIGADEYVDCDMNGQADREQLDVNPSLDANGNRYLDVCEDTSPLTIVGPWKSWHYHGEALSDLAKEFPQTPQDRAPVETRQGSVTELTFRFSKPINPNTFDETKVMVCGHNSVPGNPVTADVEDGPNGMRTEVTLVFDPGQIPNGELNPSPGDHYVAIVSDEVKDLLGNSLSGDRDVTFAASFGNVVSTGILNNWKKVNSSDRGQVVLNFTQTPTPEQALAYDVWLQGIQGGWINSTDAGQIVLSFSATDLDPIDPVCP